MKVCWSVKDYPRIRGEYLFVPGPVRTFMGLPPHTRGILPDCLDAIKQAGITPAYAGNTILQIKVLFLYGDYPRIRGEYETTEVATICGLGLPPHTRGIRIQLCADEQWGGITPAYAGNTLKSAEPSNRIWDYPRIRGEYLRSSKYTAVSLGLPPHTRGIQVHLRFFLLPSGITPAYAGNTFAVECELHFNRDYPRIRGEYI